MKVTDARRDVILAGRLYHNFLGDTCSKENGANYPKKMLFEQKKKKRILKFNPGLALISFRTSGTPSLMTELVMHIRPVERGPDFQGEPVSMNVTIISTQKYLTSSDYRSARSAHRFFFPAHANFFLPCPLSQATLPRAYESCLPC